MGRFDERRDVLFATFALSICILLQMLGVPVSMLCPDLSSDVLGTSISEGFSIPASPVSLDLPSGATTAADRPSSLRIPVLASAPFRPPLS